MKKTFMFLMALGLVAVLTACGGGSNGNSDENQTIPTTPTATQTCSITQGTPLTDTRLTVHVVCDNIQAGDTVNVTVDGNVKPADITGTTVNDFLGFANLNASTRYTATVELNGQTMDTVNITTKATPVTPRPNTAPTWTANSYNTGLTIEDGTDAVQTIKDLKPVSSDADGDTITYSIVSVSVPDSADQNAWDNSLKIVSGVLVVKNLKTNDPNFDAAAGSDPTVSVTIKATATGGSSNTVIKFTFVDVQ